MSFLFFSLGLFSFGWRCEYVPRRNLWLSCKRLGPEPSYLLETRRKILAKKKNPVDSSSIRIVTYWEKAHPSIVNSCCCGEVLLKGTLAAWCRGRDKLSRQMRRDSRIKQRNENTPEPFRDWFQLERWIEWRTQRQSKTTISRHSPTTTLQSWHFASLVCSRRRVG